MDISSTVATMFCSNIYIGLRQTATGKIHDMNTVRAVMDMAIESVGICVSVTETQFMYPSPNGVRAEPGVIVGVINYPRFQESCASLLEKTDKLAQLLMVALDQCQVTYVTHSAGQITMLTNEEEVALLKKSRGEE